MLMNPHQSQPRGRRPHPQWAFQGERPWQPTGALKRDEKELLQKSVPNLVGQNKPKPMFPSGASLSPPRAPHGLTPMGKHQKKAGRMAHNSQNQSYNADPFYQPPPKIPQFEQGRLVTFFKNGDPVFRGLPLSINRTFANIGSVLHYLSREFGMNCKRVFQWPQGVEIFSLNEFEHQSSYVVSDQHYLDGSVNYGNQLQPVHGNLKVNTSRVGAQNEGFNDFIEELEDETALSYYSPVTPRTNMPINDFSSSSKRAVDIPLYRDYDPHDTLENYPVATIRLINNFNRTAHVEVSLSGSRKNYKMLLHEFGQFFGLRDCSLWTGSLPCKKVTTLSQLYAEINRNPQFLVCGSEEMPTEAAGLTHTHSPIRTPGRSLSNGRNTVTVKKSDSKVMRGIKSYSPHDEDRLVRKQLSSSPSLLFSPRSSRNEGPIKANHVGQSKSRNSKKVSRRSNLRLSDSSDFDDFPVRNYAADGMSTMNEHPMSPIRASRSYEALTRKNRTSQARNQTLPPPVFKRPVTKAQLLNENRIRRRVGLRLEWVYGYRGKDARENLFFLPSGELMYYVGAIGVIYDPITESQRHYKSHTEDINCMAIHPSDDLVATGQIAPVHSDQKPHVRVWNYLSLNTVAIIGLGIFQTSICSVSFSSEGSKLMVLDEGDRHSLSLWKWSEDKQLAQTWTSSDTVVWGKFSPNDTNLLLTFGKEHIYFWRYDETNRKLVRDKSSGLFGDQFPQPKFVTAATFMPNGILVTGDSNGSLLLWNRSSEGTYSINSNYSQNLAMAHKKSIFSIVVSGSNQIISSGGTEIKIWEFTDDVGIKNTANQNILESSGYIRSLVVGKNNIMFTGTTKNCILEGPPQGKFRYLVQGHSDEVWALSCHSKDSTFVTGGYDCQLIKWFAPIHRSIWRTPLEKQCLSVSFHPTEDVVAIGTSIGRLIVLNSYNGMHICSVQMASTTELLTCIKYAPEGDMIGCGSQDGPLYVSLVEDGGRTYRRHKAGIIENSLGSVQNIDWHDEVAELIQFSTRSGNHGFATIEDMKLVRVEPSAVNDEWSTYTCPTGKLVKGVLNRLRFGEMMTACDMVNRNSPMFGLVAASTNYGRILLTSLRSDLEIEAKARTKIRHKLSQSAYTPEPDLTDDFKYQLQESRMCSQNITALRFTSDGRYLIAVAGKDGSIYQYATNVTELWGGNVISENVSK